MHFPWTESLYLDMLPTHVLPVHKVAILRSLWVPNPRPGSCPSLRHPSRDPLPKSTVRTNDKVESSGDGDCSSGDFSIQWHCYTAIDIEFYSWRWGPCLYNEDPFIWYTDRSLDFVVIWWASNICADNITTVDYMSMATSFGIKASWIHNETPAWPRLPLQPVWKRRPSATYIRNVKAFIQMLTKMHRLVDSIRGKCILQARRRPQYSQE